MATKSKRSNSSVHKLVSKETLKRSFSSISSRDRYQSEFFYENNFAFHFKKYCKENNIEIPNVRLIFGDQPASASRSLRSSRTTSKLHSVTSIDNYKTFKLANVTGTSSEIQAFYDSLDTNILQKLNFNSCKIDSRILEALHLTLENFKAVTVLKLEFCSLGKEELEVLQGLLKTYDNIKELSVNGNPNPYQNFYKLLVDTHLSELSMKFCKINERGTRNLFEQIKNNVLLIVLNLASNYITDDATEFVAEALRSNRTLLCLNLADNWITDVGCGNLMNVLRKFPMTHEEVVQGRRKRLEYVLKRNALIEQYKVTGWERPETRSIDTQRRSVVSLTRTGRRSSKDSSRRSSAGLGSSKNCKIANPTPEWGKNIRRIVEKISKYSEPKRVFH